MGEEGALETWVREGKDFKWGICGKGYNYGYLLKGHLEIPEKEVNRDYFCEKCGHWFDPKTLRNFKNPI